MKMVIKDCGIGVAAVTFFGAVCVVFGGQPAGSEYEAETVAIEPAAAVKLKIEDILDGDEIPPEPNEEIAAEESVAEEPVAEEPVEAPAVEAPAVEESPEEPAEEPAAFEAEAEEPTVEEEAESLLDEIMGEATEAAEEAEAAEPAEEAPAAEEPAAEESVAEEEEAAAEAPAADEAVDELLLDGIEEEATEPAAEEAEAAAPAEEAVAEVAAAEEPAAEEEEAAAEEEEVAAEEPAADEAVDELLLDGIEEEATEPADEAEAAAPAEEPAAEAPAAEEPAAEEAATEETAAEEPAADEAVDELLLDGIMGEEPEAAAEAEAAAPAEEAVAEVAAEEEPAAEEAATEETVAEEPAADEAVDELLLDGIMGEEPEAAAEAETAAPAEETVAEVAAAEEEPAAEEAAEETAAVEPAAESPAAEEAKPDSLKDTPENRELAELAALETTRRKAIDAHCIDCLKSGEEALLLGKYEMAISRFKDCLEKVRDSENETRLRAEEGLGEAWYRQAIVLDQIKKYDDAEKSAREARLLRHPKAQLLLAQIQDHRDHPAPPPPPTHERRWNQPEYKQQMLDIVDRMSEAREYYATGEYDDCRRVVEFILRDYPWYEDAVGLLRKVNSRLDKYFDAERLATRVNMINQVTETWSPRTYGVKYSDAGFDDMSAGESKETAGLASTEEMRVLDKMRNIMIPEIDFRQANIADIITYLSDASRENDDPDVPPESRGVNIVLKLGSAGETPAAPAAGDFADDFGADTYSQPTAAVGGIPPITINSRFITLLNALDMIMEMANLKYRVRGNIVMVMPANAPDSELLHRMYPVLPSFVEKAASFSSEGEQASGDFGEPIQIETATFTGTTDWKKFFEELGVQWPEGSAVKYVSTIGKLIVKNTAENLSSLEKVLGALNVTPYQVEIEVRFVEVMQTDLDSLGLEWQLDSKWAMFENKKDSNLPYQDRRRIEMAAGPITQGFNYLAENENVKINNGLPVHDTVATFSSILTNPELSVILHMLSSKRDTDLLSAPKVVAASGKEAIIKVVTEYIYPTSYDVEMLESGTEEESTTYTGAVVEPQDFVTREVGVVLSVTPEVTEDGSRIFLTLSPAIVSEPTWKNYGSTYPVFGPDGEMEYVMLPMEQPFFPVRSIVTQLEAYNGSTVVMGGMITEERYTNEDKIPILGDIPLIGHLFRYKYEQSQKRNLLLFVTAKLVDSGGHVIRESTEPGLFEK